MVIVSPERVAVRVRHECEVPSTVWHQLATRQRGARHGARLFTVLLVQTHAEILALSGQTRGAPGGDCPEAGTCSRLDPPLQDGPGSRDRSWEAAARADPQAHALGGQLHPVTPERPGGRRPRTEGHPPGSATEPPSTERSPSWHRAFGERGEKVTGLFDVERAATGRTGCPGLPFAARGPRTGNPSAGSPRGGFRPRRPGGSMSRCRRAGREAGWRRRRP